MQNIPQDQTIKRFQLLSDALKNAIFSEQTSAAIAKSCALRDVPPEKTPTIGQLTGRVLLGYLQPESFAFEIQKETGIDALKATQVAHDIDTEIFSGVRLELKKLYPPTIQTPTVQAQGFAPRESGIRNQESGTEEKPRPYVVQIPERFRRPETRNLKPETQNSQPEAHNLSPEIQEKPQESGIRKQELGMEQKAIAPRAQGVIPDSQFMIHDSRAPIQEKQQELGIKPPPPKPASPPMDPVVPLPTFIQSKFKTDELGVAGQESRIRNQELGMEQKTAAPQAQPEIQDSSKNDALKSAFGKFTVSSTAPETTKEPMSPYRETIEEPKKPTEQKPAAKTQGKVIDLSKF